MFSTHGLVAASVVTAASGIPVASAQTGAFVPVTQAMQANPEPADRLHISRTYNDIVLAPSARSLTPDEVYAVTAYVLFLNDIVRETDVLDAATLPKVRMPNHDRFLGVEIDGKPGQKRPLGFYPGK